MVHCQPLHIKQPCAVPGSLSFGDVAVGFTWKEWQQLDLEQRTLDQDVMLEDCSHLLSVGCQVGKPAVIFRLEQGKEPWIEEEEEMDTWHFAESHSMAHVGMQWRDLGLVVQGILPQPPK
ncbi:zinc finger protein 37A-like isoform X2 [Aotus nancymaae]|uniref:zinc finger protein 37A-like isoform X2 n=1 Tax=Aotus nancymaae TaxID=37293 RepID=UPI0030FE8EE5